MTRETVAGWSMIFVMGVGLAACGAPRSGNGSAAEFSEPEPEPEPDPGAALNVMEPGVEEMPDPRPDPEPEVPNVAVPAVRCTTNVVAEDPYPGDLPGWDRFEFDVQIAPETTSFQIVGYNERGNVAMLEGMTAPGGEFVDFWVDPFYARLISSWYYTTGGSVAALTLPSDPMTPLETGRYTFAGLSQDAEFCYYVVEDSAPGTKLRLNVFFVGTELRASSAPNDENWQEVTAVLHNTFAAAGIELEIEYVELPDHIRDEHAVPYSMGDLDRAVRDAVDAVDPLPMRSIDVFLWDEFGGEAEQMMGLARGLPEAVGLHGERGNGVTLQMMNLLGFEGVLGSSGEVVGNIDIGLSIAHEVGHLLGLFHTSELHAADYDSLHDTPECANARQTLDGCPDATNLMFPFGPVYASSELSELQIATMTGHPSLMR